MKTSKLFVSSFLLPAILILGSGCAKKADDAKISSDIQTKFSQDSGLSTKQLSIQSANGVVTLSGNVDNDAQREAASRQAASTPGVKEVVNNLQMGSAPALASSTAKHLKAASSAASPTDKGKSSAGKKARKSHASGDSGSDSANDANNYQETAGNQSAPEAASQMAAPPPTNTAAATPAASSSKETDYRPRHPDHSSPHRSHRQRKESDRRHLPRHPERPAHL